MSDEGSDRDANHAPNEAAAENGAEAETDPDAGGPSTDEESSDGVDLDALPDVDDRAIDHEAAALAIVETAADAEDVDCDLGSAVAALVERIAALERERAALERELEDAESRLKRTQADFQNYKKRAKRERERVEEHATEELAERLVGVRDDLDRALDEAADGDAAALREGVRMTLAEFDRVLEGEGVERIDPEPGDPVDPQVHEVLMRVESDAAPGTIDAVHRPGYRMGERVLQEAQVTVSEEAEAA